MQTLGAAAKWSAPASRPEHRRRRGGRVLLRLSRRRAIVPRALAEVLRSFVALGGRSPAVWSKPLRLHVRPAVSRSTRRWFGLRRGVRYSGGRAPECRDRWGTPMLTVAAPSCFRLNSARSSQPCHISAPSVVGLVSGYSFEAGARSAAGRDLRITSLTSAFMAVINGPQASVPRSGTGSVAPNLIAGGGVRPVIPHP